jgi:hypothetical protein
MLSLTCDLLDLHLLSSLDCRRGPLHPASSCPFDVKILSIQRWHRLIWEYSEVATSCAKFSKPGAGMQHSHCAVFSSQMTYLTYPVFELLIACLTSLAGMKTPEASITSD